MKIILSISEKVCSGVPEITICGFVQVVAVTDWACPICGSDQSPSTKSRTSPLLNPTKRISGCCGFEHKDRTGEGAKYSRFGRSASISLRFMFQKQILERASCSKPPITHEPNEWQQPIILTLNRLRFVTYEVWKRKDALLPEPNVLNCQPR